MKRIIDRNARIMSDEHGGYKGVEKLFAGGHFTTQHSADEFARGTFTQTLQKVQTRS